MCSVSDEIIPLVKQISTVKARGQVDKWLAELEIQMRLSLRQQIDNALQVSSKIISAQSKPFTKCWNKHILLKAVKKFEKILPRFLYLDNYIMSSFGFNVILFAV